MNARISLYCKRLGVTDTANRWTLADNSDGNGPYIADWRLSIPQPTAADLTAITDAEIEAERAAAEQARLETPLVFDQPIQARIEIPATDGHVYGVEVDPDGGEVVTVQRQSVRLSKAEYEAARAARMTDRAQKRQRIAAIATDLDQVQAALDQINVTASGPLGVAIAATTGVNKTALTAVRTTLVDIKTALANLRQAAEKMRREIR
jgi:hypothetical protein